MPLAPRRLAITTVMCLLLAPPAAGAATLQLDPAWYGVVRPYRYDESRRWEAGWNRGADVVAAGGLVRSPVSGRVRFAGAVAGRPVVTIATRLEGEPAVVTFTGLRSIGRLAAGGSVDRGAVVGTGVVVHVGAYDPERRTRYLPVELADADAPAAAGMDGGGIAPLLPSGSPLADAVAERLRTAILGDATVLVPMGLVARPGSAGAGVPSTLRMPPLPPPTRGAPRDLRRAEVRSSSAGPSRQQASREEPTGVRSPRRLGVAWHLTMFEGVGVGPIATAPGATAWRAAGGGRPDRRDSHATTGVAAAASGAGDSGAGPAADPSTAPSPDARRAEDESGIDAAATLTSSAIEHASVPGDHTAALAIAGLVLALGLVPPLVAWRRRRRVPARPASVLHQPLPVLLPHVRPYAYPVVRSDGSSVLPDVALAWADAHPGTSPGPEPLAPARARAPEPA